MTDTAASGFKPWQRPAASDSAPASDRGTQPETPSQPEGARQQKVQRVVADVLDRTHRAVNQARETKVTQEGLAKSLEANLNVRVRAGQLQVGERTWQIAPEKASELTILQPQRDLIRALADVLESGVPALASLPEGVDGGATARWFFEVAGTPYRHHRISRITSLDALAGALRPDAQGRLRVHHGPLTECIMNGGVFVAECLEQAEKDVLAILSGLAKGVKEFHHPVSGRIIPVHPDFRLVLMTSNRVRCSAELTSECANTEVASYTRDDHVSLLTERVGISRSLANKLADKHEEITRRQVSDQPEQQIDFGRGFPVAYPLLERVARRLNSLSTPQPQDVADAIWGVYGTRLQNESSRAALRAVITSDGSPEPRRAVAPHANADWTPIGEQIEAMAQAEAAHRAGEPVLFTAPGQAGATSLVTELGRRFGREVVTVTCHPGIDPQSLIERPIFKDGGGFEFVPGVITDALLNGKILYFDHIDHVSTERQEALMRLVEKTTVTIMRDGQVVTVPVHPDTRIYFSATAGTDRTRRPPPARERALLTEIRFDAPTLDDTFTLVPERATPEVREIIKCVAKEIHAEAPQLGLNKLQRFRDFAGAATLLADFVPADQAVAHAARLLFDETKSPALAKLPALVDGEPPLWMQVMGLTQSEVSRRVSSTGYDLTPSMRDSLLPLALAYKLQRPVLTVGKAAAGKTVLGVLWAAIADKKPERFNFSAATEASDLYGGLSPMPTKDGVRFQKVSGPVIRATLESEGAWIGDERNLSTEAMMSMKSLLDHRRAVIDPDTGLPQSIGASILYFAENPLGTRGRKEQPPVIDDCMFRVVVREKPVAERADIVASQCGLPRHWRTSAAGGLRAEKSFDPVLSIAKFFVELEGIKSEQRDQLGASFGPLTCTERDMLKVAQRAEYYIKRDGVTDPNEQRRILGRETLRLIRGLLQSPEGTRRVYDKLVKHHFGADVSELTRAKTVERVTIDGVAYLQIGAARKAVREIADPVQQAMVPGKDRIGEPVGAQLEFLEDALVALEVGQPLAIVGITGSGKTMLVRYLAHHLNQPLLEQAYNADMSEENIFGTTVITPEGDVRFQESPLAIAAQIGAWYVGDELLTLPNQTRESLNPVTEGSEIQVPSRPPRKLRRKDCPPEDRWHAEFRQIFTTNGDDIRADGFSDPEASRLVILGIREPRGFDELNEIAQRDYCTSPGRELLRSPTSFETSDRNNARDAIMAFCRPGNAFGDAFKLACIDVEPPKGVMTFLKKLVGVGKRDEANFKKTFELALLTTPIYDLTPEQERAVASAFWQFKGDKFAPVRELLSAMLVKAKDPQSAARVAGMVPAGSLSIEAMKVAEANAVTSDRLTSPEEVARLVSFFDDLRTLQAGGGASPLTPRLLSSFIEFYTEKRRSTGVAAAAMRATETNLLSKIPPELQAEALARMTRTFGQSASDAVELLVPRPEGDAVWFGNTRVPLGAETPWRPSNERFPLTPARVQNLACIADSDIMGRGRPISLTDDPNGESMETLREYARLLGKRLVVVTLTPNTDIDLLIEKLVLTDDPTVKGGFTPEMQEIAQAVRNGHLLVLRGCGSVPSNKLERLNSLGDGRQSIELPRSARAIKAHPGFRMIMLRKPGAPHEFSPALENRLLTPLLSTRAQAATQEVLSRSASELLENIHHRTQISVDSARLLARFHICMNELLRKGEFASALAIGSFLNRDAEAVARRLKHLTAQGAVTDEVETLHRLVLDVYGERFDNESDRALFSSLAKRFISEGIAPATGTDVSATQHFVRFGDWSVPRDSRGIRSGVPDHEAILPSVAGLDEIQSKGFAAAQFGESLHVHGDGFVGRAAIQSLARLSASEVIEIEGNEELTESSLFGGLVQNDDGRFERYEGLVWRAQREAAILLIRNAARLPRDVLMRLSEVAATDNVERIRDGKLEVQQKRLRLVLQTATGDPPLPQELAAACTRVRAEPVTQRRDLIALTGHVLAGVPGGTAMATAFVDLIAAADASLAGVSLQNRQVVRFDGRRLLLMASDVARGAAAPKANLEQVVTSAVVRHVLAPVDRLSSRDAVAAAVNVCLAQLYGTSGVLTAHSSNAVDIVANPHLATLKKDYDQVAGPLTARVLKAAKEALTQVIEAGNDSDLRMLVGRLPTGGILPAEIERACSDVLDTDPASEISSKARSAANRLIKTIDDSGLVDKAVEGDVLEFMRGARLWDLEHRCEIVSRYVDAFALCEGFGSEVATSTRRELGAVTERFEASAAENTIRQVRESVEQALEAYRTHGGGTDNVLHERYEKVIERWDWVTSTPLFKNHHQLRGHLAELHTALDALREAHDDRGASREEVTGLLASLRAAGSALEGIRIAEQSADLRRAVADAQRGTREVVDDLLAHLGNVKTLRAAKEALASLSRIKTNASELERAEFLNLPEGPIRVDAPVRPSKAELEAEAEREAERSESDKLEAARSELFAKLAEATLRRKAPAVDKFFAGYDLELGDTGLAQAIEPQAPSSAQAEYERDMARLVNESASRIAETKKKVFAELEKKKAEEYETAYRERVESAIERTASRAAMAAIALGKDLQLLGTQLGDAADPETTKVLEEARAALRTAEGEARAWGDGLRRRFGFSRPLEAGGTPLYLQKHEPPQRTRACDLVRQALAKLDARISQAMAGLPDISPLEGHIASCGAIEDVLASSDTLGLASSRYAALHQASRENPEIAGALQASIARLGPDATARNLLLRVAAFSEIADTLSSRFAAKSGIAHGFANVIEATMRAAQVIRQQPLRDKSTRSCITALDQTLQRYQEAAKSAKPDEALQQLEREIVELKRAFLGAQTTAKSVTLQDAGVDAIFELLSAGSSRGGSHGERIRNALEGEAFATGDKAVAATVLSRIITPMSAQPMQVRDTELRLIDLASLGLKEPQHTSRREADSGRGQVRSAMDKMLERTVQAGERLTQAHSQARTLLATLEQATQGSTWTRASASINAAKDALDTLARSSDTDTPLLHTSLDRALDALDKVLAVVEPSALFPAAATAKLAEVVHTGRELKLVFDNGLLSREVTRFAMGARSQLDEVQELASKGNGGGGGHDAMALERLAEIINAVGTDGVLLTAYSRRALLHSMSARLGQLALGLTGTQAQGASELSARATGFRDELAQTVPTATAERCLAEIAAAFTELGAQMDAQPKVTDPQLAHYLKLAETIDEVCLGSLERHKLVAAIEVAIDRTAAFAADQRTLAAAGRDIEAHLRALHGELFNDDAARVADHFVTGIAPYLKDRESAIARLNASKRALAAYDSTAGSPVALVEELVEAARAASALATGPYAGRVAAAVVDLTDAAQKALSTPGIGSEIQKVSDALSALHAEAERYAKDAKSSDHFEGMALKLREYLGKLGKNKPNVTTLQQAQTVVDAVLGLIDVEARSVARQVASVASKYFSGSIRGLEIAAPRADIQATATPNMGRTPTATWSGSEGGTSAGSSSGGAAGAVTGSFGSKAPNGASGAVHGGAAVGDGSGGGGGGGVQPVDTPPAPEPMGDAPLKDGSTPTGELNVQQGTIGEGASTGRPTIEVIELSEVAVQNTIDEMQAALAAQRLVGASPSETRPKNAFEQFIAANPGLVDTLRTVLRQHPCELVVIHDQSGSTEGQIVQHEQAVVALTMGALMGSEGNCAILGFGNNVGIGSYVPGTNMEDAQVWVHKAMSQPLTADVADATYRVCGNAGGGTILKPAINTGLGQFTTKANDKLLLIMTDAQVNNASEIRALIDQARANGVGVAMLGFGAADNVRTVAGDFGLHVSSFRAAVDGAASLLTRCLVSNQGRFRGRVEAKGSGIGTAFLDVPLSAASSIGPMAASLRMGHDLPAVSEPGEVLGATGDARDIDQTATRAIYDAACKSLEQAQRKATATASYRQCRAQVTELASKHQRDGTAARLRDAVSMSLPRAGGMQLMRKQLSGPLLDEQQLPLYVAGLAQGMPPSRIFKKKKGSDEIRAQVVLAIDESSSMGDSDKARANIEAMIAYGDALKAVDPNIKIAVIGYSERVRLHAGFDQDWNEELKAHLLHQIRCEGDATDDERGIAEGAALLDMLEADIGQIVSFGDGQGLPGTHKTLQAAVAKGYSVIAAGVGAECKGVLQFGDHALYARNLAQFVHQFANVALRCWERARQTVGK